MPKRKNRKRGKSKSSSGGRSKMSKSRFSCHLCPKKGEYPTRDRLISHYYKSHNAIYCCNYCPRQFDSESSQADHVARQHVSRASFACIVCGWTARQKKQVHQHQIAEHRHLEDLACSICGTLSPDKDAFHAHKKYCSSSIHFRTASESSAAGKSLSRSDPPQINSSSYFSCKYCPEQFKTRDQHSRHLIDVHKNVRDTTDIRMEFFCLFCFRRYPDNRFFDHVRHHMKVESMPASCNECFEWIRKPDGLQHHQRCFELEAIRFKFATANASSDSFPPCADCAFIAKDFHHRNRHVGWCHKPQMCDHCGQEQNGLLGIKMHKCTSHHQGQRGTSTPASKSSRDSRSEGKRQLAEHWGETSGSRPSHFDMHQSGSDRFRSCSFSDQKFNVTPPQPQPLSSSVVIKPVTDGRNDSIPMELPDSPEQQLEKDDDQNVVFVPFMEAGSGCKEKTVTPISTIKEENITVPSLSPGIAATQQEATPAKPSIVLPATELPGKNQTKPVNVEVTTTNKQQDHRVQQEHAARKASSSPSSTDTDDAKATPDRRNSEVSAKNVGGGKKRRMDDETGKNTPPSYPEKRPKRNGPNEKQAAVNDNLHQLNTSSSSTSSFSSSDNDEDKNDGGGKKNSSQQKSTAPKRSKALSKFFDLSSDDEESDPEPSDVASAPRDADEPWPVVMAKTKSPTKKPRAAARVSTTSNTRASAVLPTVRTPRAVATAAISSAAVTTTNRHTAIIEYLCNLCEPEDRRSTLYKQNAIRHVEHVHKISQRLAISFITEREASSDLWTTSAAEASGSNPPPQQPADTRDMGVTASLPCMECARWKKRVRKLEKFMADVVKRIEKTKRALADDE